MRKYELKVTSCLVLKTLVWRAQGGASVGGYFPSLKVTVRVLAEVTTWTGDQRLTVGVLQIKTTGQARGTNCLI